MFPKLLVIGILIAICSCNKKSDPVPEPEPILKTYEYVPEKSGKYELKSMEILQHNPTLGPLDSYGFHFLYDSAGYLRKLDGTWANGGTMAFRHSNFTAETSVESPDWVYDAHWPLSYGYTMQKKKDISFFLDQAVENKLTVTLGNGATLEFNITPKTHIGMTITTGGAAAFRSDLIYARKVMNEKYLRLEDADPVTPGVQPRQFRFRVIFEL